MRTKSILLSVFLALAILLSACAPAQQQQITPRTMSVNGSAQVSLTPDIAHINIGVHSENPDAATAVAQNNAQAQAIVAAIQAQAVDSKDILTTNFSIYPQDDYSPEGQKVGTRFVVDNTVYVTLRDLKKIGDVIGSAVGAGANSINGISFDVADKTPMLAEARKAAVDNARQQAEELATAAGVTLGEVQSLSFYNNVPVPVAMDMKAVGVGGGGSSVPISAGQLTLTVDVSVIYIIK
jgi:uncharacterized protein YggE